MPKISNKGVLMPESPIRKLVPKKEKRKRTTVKAVQHCTAFHPKSITKECNWPTATSKAFPISNKKTRVLSCPKCSMIAWFWNWKSKVCSNQQFSPKKKPGNPDPKRGQRETEAKRKRSHVAFSSPRVTNLQFKLQFYA